jgi:hypothetical protein
MNKWEYNQAVQMLFLNFKKAYDTDWPGGGGVLRGSFCIIFSLLWYTHETSLVN